MATKQEFMEYIVEQLQGAGTITYRKMFGEYGVYRDGKIFAVVCDDQLFVKVTPAGKEQFPDLPEAPPYQGAKNYFLVQDVENREFLTSLTEITCQALPEPKPKRKKA